MSKSFRAKVLLLIENIEDQRVREKERRLLKSVLTRGINSVDDLQGVLSSGTKRQKLAACWIIAEFGAKRHAELLLPFLENTRVSQDLRMQAAASLSLLGSHSSIKRLLSVLANGKTAVQREAAAYALTWFQDVRVGEELVCVLSNRDEQAEVRAQAAEGIGYNYADADKRTKAYKMAASVLIESLEDPVPEIRFWSAFALGSMGCRQALPALRKLKRSDRAVVPGWWYVREEAADAIATIEGRTPAPRVPLEKRD